MPAIHEPSGSVDPAAQARLPGQHAADPASAQRRRHWDGLYGRTPDDKVSWYQPHAAVSLELFDQLGVTADQAVVDVGGGASRLVDGLVARGFRDVTVVDISRAALGASRKRLGASAPVQWVCADLLGWQPDQSYDVWHDRAVFHFLVEPGDRARYLDVLGEALAPGAAVVIATFGSDGPSSCSGLPVARYDADELGAALGDRFDVTTTRREDHTTPAGVHQPFLWVGARAAEGS